MPDPERLPLARPCPTQPGAPGEMPPRTWKAQHLVWNLHINHLCMRYYFG